MWGEGRKEPDKSRGSSIKGCERCAIWIWGEMAIVKIKDNGL